MIVKYRYSRKVLSEHAEELRSRLQLALYNTDSKSLSELETLLQEIADDLQNYVEDILDKDV